MPRARPTCKPVALNRLCRSPASLVLCVPSICSLWLMRLERVCRLVLSEAVTKVVTSNMEGFVLSQ